MLTSIAGTAAGKSLNVNSYAGIDNLTVSNAVKGGNIGMGGDVDSVLSAKKLGLNITLGDGADATSTASKPLSKVTVGGQGGADTFLCLAQLQILTSAVAKVRTFSAAALLTVERLAASTIVGGSEVDTIGVSTDGIVFGANLLSTAGWRRQDLRQS